MAAIFISHSNLDRVDSDNIKSSIERLGFERIFLDFDKTSGIGVGDNWEQTLYEEISRCHVVVIVLTPNWSDSKWCFVEFAQARALGKVILPVICAPLTGKTILAEVQAADAVTMDKDGIARLEQKLLAISDELARGFRLPPGRSPYPGIHSFEAEDAAIFFGRDEETRAIIERLDARRTKGGARLLVVIGASGSGKSSLLKAGVLPQLARRRAQWLVLPCLRLEKRPLVALAKSIALFLEKPDEWTDLHDLLTREQDALDHLDKLFETLRTGERRLSTILLPIDQLEELFTISVQQERERFLRLLSLALDPRRQLPFLAVATGTSDVLQGLIEAGELGKNCETAPLIPMPFDRVSKLVEGPAAIGGINVEKGLTELIARDVETSEALPLLAYTLYLLYERSKSGKHLTVDAYKLLGDPNRKLNPIQNSVRLVADETIAALKPSDAELVALRDAFIPYLVRIRSDDGRRVRHVTHMSDLPEAARGLIRALIDARLLTIHAGSSLVEVAHEALFQAWPMLDAWLIEEQEFLHGVERLKSAFEVWSQAEGSAQDEALIRGPMLTRARDWLVHHPERFRGRDMETLALFIQESARVQEAEKARITEQEKRTKSLQHLLVRGSLLATLLFAAIAVFAGLQYLNEKKAEARASDAAAQALVQRNAALVNQARFLVDLANQKYKNQDYEVAMALSLDALPGDQAAAGKASKTAEATLYESVTALRDIHVLAGHIDQVRSATFSSDGRFVVTASWDRTARVWDARTGALKGVLQGHDDRLGSAVFSKDGTRVVTASWDGTARIYDLSGNALAVLKGHKDQIYTAVFSPDGRQVVTASKDGTAGIWDAETGDELHVLKHDGAVHTAVFSLDGTKVLTASEDYTAGIWDAATGARTGTLKGHTDTVSSASFSRGGKHIVTASWDKTARVWLADTQTQIMALPARGAVLSAAFSPDGQQVVTASADRSAQIWRISDGSVVARLEGHAKQVITASYSPNGQYIVTSSLDRTARVWRASDGAQQAILQAHDDFVYDANWSPDSQFIVTASRDRTARIWSAIDPTDLIALRGHTDVVNAVAYSPDGQKIATASDDNSARVWDAKTGVQLLDLKGHTGHVGAVAFSPDGKTIATASLDHSARLWSVETGLSIRTLTGHSDRVDAVTYSPSGDQLVTASADKTVRIWDAKTGAQTAQLQHKNKVNGASFSPDGKWIVTVANDGTYNDGVCTIWAAADGSMLREMGQHLSRVHMARFAPDNQRVVTALQDNVAIIWNVQTGAKIESLEGDSQQLEAAVFSPDGRYAATASWDDTARVFDTRDAGVQPKILTGHGNHVETVAFLPGAARVITSSLDGTVRVWDLGSSAEVAQIPAPGKKIHAVALAPDGKSVVIASGDRSVGIWPVFPTTSGLVEHAQTMMPRQLSDAERKTFFMIQK